VSEPGTEISVIVPTLNEARNLPLLVPRIAAALTGREYEILIVDDASPDDTPDICAELSRHFPLRLIVRDQPQDGLSGAVLVGMSQAHGRTLVVMDADLQHPPESIPALLRELDGGADFVIGSRYAPGGTTAQHWGLHRRLNSWVATLLARPFTGRISDPMSGFFALRRVSYEAAERLTPLGYKIALELMCKCRVSDVREVPIHFAARAHGQSKLTIAQQFRYLEHLSRLYDFTYARASPIAKFLIAVAAGWTTAVVAYALLLSAHAGPVAAVTIAYLPTLAVIALLHLRYVRTQRTFLVTRRPWIDFGLIALAEWVTVLVVASWLSWRLVDAGRAEMLLIPLASATLVRYVLRKELLQDIRGLRRRVRPDLPASGPPQCG
jgi:dolichol-phosphate mannosyltransferase